MKAFNKRGGATRGPRECASDEHSWGAAERQDPGNIFFFLVCAIKVYQRTLSPDHSWLRVFFPSGVCKFEPTCSEYMAEALHRHGSRGLLLGLKRVGRCHPLAAGGSDPVPEA